MSKGIEDELYEMVNIYPADSGLPMTVWAGPRGNARHDVRVKVNMAQRQPDVDRQHRSRRGSSRAAPDRRAVVPG